MLQKVVDPGRQLRDEDIATLEAKLPYPLPDDYKVFLKKYNGGHPVEGVFPIFGFKNNPTGVVNWFFGINTELETHELLWNHTVMLRRIPWNFLPIGRDPSGDLICISLSGADEGTVYFWDWYDQQPGPDPGYGNVYKIADSFEEFLQSLHEDTEG